MICDFSNLERRIRLTDNKNMDNKYRIKDNELCPCGSNKTYGDCCKNREDKKTSAKDGSDMNELMKKSFISCCLHPKQEDCSNEYVKYHKLQSNDVLDILATDNQVYTFANGKTQSMEVDEDGTTVPVPVFEKIDKDKAQIHSCFCSTHDDIVFESVEKEKFQPDNQEQIITLAYRVFIYEYYNELVVENMYKKSVREFPSLLRNPNFVKALHDNQDKIEEMASIKLELENSLENENYSGIRSVVFKVEKTLPVADFALFEPWFDINGKGIKNKSKIGMKNICMSVIPGEGESYIVLNCLENKMKAYEKLFLQIKEKPAEVVEAYFNFFIPLFSQNIVVSPSFWDNMEQTKQMSFLYLTNLTGRDAYDISLSMQNHLKNLRINKRSHATNPKSYNIFE